MYNFCVILFHFDRQYLFVSTRVYNNYKLDKRHAKAIYTLILRKLFKLHL